MQHSVRFNRRKEILHGCSRVSQLRCCTSPGRSLVRRDTRQVLLLLPSHFLEITAWCAQRRPACVLRSPQLDCLISCSSSIKQLRHEARGVGSALGGRDGTWNEGQSGRGLEPGQAAADGYQSCWRRALQVPGGLQASAHQNDPRQPRRDWYVLTPAFLDNK